MLVALSPAVTKFCHYRSEAQKISAQCSRGLWEGVFQIWSNCDEKWLFYRRFCEFWATWPKLFGDAWGWPRITSDTFADTLESFGALDLGMTFKVEVKVKVMGPTRGPTLATVNLGPRLIVTEIWAWFRIVGIRFGTRDHDMTLTWPWLPMPRSRLWGPLGAYPTKKRSWAYHLPLWRHGPLKFVHALAYKAVSACHLLGIGVSMVLSTYA